MIATFRSLTIFNYRLWFAGALVSNTGAWMQRTAQDWIVLTELSDNDATALGITMALQFGPMLVLMPLSGLMADRFDRKRLLMWTQGLQGVLAIGLGILVVSGHAQLWQVYGFALLLGIVTALDGPARQSFASELVTEKDLSNAVALNAASFQLARLIGPAVAGVLIAVIGSGPVFLINGISFAAVLIALGLIRTEQLNASPRLAKARGQFADGLRYVGSRHDLVLVLLIVFLIGTFSYNFPVFIATMSTIEFGGGSAEFGVLSSIIAFGALGGSLTVAGRKQVRFSVIVIASLVMGGGFIAGALMPSYWTFAVALIPIGAASMILMNTANAYLQTTVDPQMRGRVMAMYLAIWAGGTPLGGPLVGWVADTFGPRWSLVVGGAAGLVGAAIGGIWMLRNRRIAETPVELPTETRELATQEIAVTEAATER